MKISQSINTEFSMKIHSLTISVNVKETYAMISKLQLLPKEVMKIALVVKVGNDICVLQETKFSGLERIIWDKKELCLNFTSYLQLS